MNPSVIVEICTGTTCFVMGAGQLLNLSEELPDRLKGLVDIRGSHCLGVCSDPQNGKPPFVRVDQRLLSEASVESIIAACDQALANLEGSNHAI
jgi:NADH:ubiquinone oxidoreductase subunit E